MSEEVLIAVLGLVGVIGVGIVSTLGVVLGKLLELKKAQAVTAVDAAEARRLSARTDESINHRDTPLSDRLDDVRTAVEESHKSVAGIAEKLAAQGAEQAAQGRELKEQRKDIIGIREDHLSSREEIGLLHGEDREIRKELSGHIRDTAPMMPMLKELHKQYTPRQRPPMRRQ